MSTDVARSSAASSRGRGTGRGGRGGFGGRSANPRRPNGEKSADGFDDDDDVGQLRKQYGSKLDTIKELFPDWSDADILYALQETDGDIELAATRISEGSVSQWGEVSKPKKSSAKAKDSGVHATASDISGSRPARGGRVDSGRGGRGRGAGAERARGAGRGRAGSQAVTSNGHQSKEQLSTPTDEAWETAATSTSQSTGADSWANAAAGATPAPKAATTASPAPKHAKAVPTNTAPEAAAPKPAAPAVKTWASMLRQPIVPKPAPKPKETPEATQAPEPAATLPTTEEPTPEPAAEPTPEPAPAEEQPEVADEPKIIEPEVALPPPEDNLTKVNLELLPDESKPLATATVASTTADSWDPRQQAPLSAVATPLSASQAQHQAARPAASGFAASALKATDRPAQRMPSYQRRLLEQEEAVRMPGNREVDRTAVQFGAFNLGDSEEDIDGDREEPETRTQPPPESPSAPRAALPPVSQATPGADAFSSAQKGSSISAATPIAAPTGPVGSAAQTPQAPGASQQFRQQFQQTNAQEPAGFQQKPYDSFAQQNPATTSAGFDSFPATTSQAPGPQGGFSSASPGDYSSYYNAEQSGRNAYNNYYAQQYAQQGGSQHEGHGSSRGFGAYGAGQTDNISQYPQSGAQQSRFGAAAAATDSQNSGHNTPNPTTQSQHQAGGQNSQPQSGAHQQPHGNHYGQHPYYTSPYYAQYMNQAYGGYGQGYGGGPYGKSGGYGQPHQYGMNPQGPYDHSSSPAATSGFGGQSSVSGRDSGLGSSVDNYGRAGSSQAGGQGGFGGSSFGGSHDTFGRGSGYPQSGQGFNAPNAQAAGGASGADDLKPYGVDSKTGAGPSPSLSGAARPGSATNTPGAPGLPPVQSGQQGAGGYGGYPGHGQQSHGLHGGQSGNSAYGLGGSGAQGQAGNNPYGGGYGGSQGFGNYYGNRQQQQHQGGWGGNYH